MALPPDDSKSKFKATVKDQSGAGRIKIGELLCKAGYITTTQFEQAKAEQKKSGRLLSLILLDLGFIEEDTVLNFLSRMHNIPSVTVAREPPGDEAIALLPYETLRDSMAIPLRMAGSTLQLAMAEPTDTGAVESLQNLARRNISVYVATARDIADAYRQFYKIDDEEYRNLLGGQQLAGEDEETVVGVEDFGALVADASDGFEIERGEDDTLAMDQFSASDAPIIKLVNGILVKAVQDGISDIHIEPFNRNMQVRYRKDGSLFKSMNLPLNIKNALISRLKILADLDITERRVPQDGRIKMRIGRNKMVDFRVSSLPTLWGEGIVLRILDKSSLNIDLTRLGFETETFAALKRCLNRPQGMLLVTGPTGSGKTVTLYSALNSLNNEDIKILTAEDPVEFNFKGINQVNVNPDVGMTFAAALRAFLRQDPDIIMVGEIRDLETAEIGIKAAMTGHLVFSTLHTNDSAATIGRMIDIGIPAYMLASSLTMVLSQRLARRLCPHCKTVVQHDPKYLLEAGFAEDDLEGLITYGPRGCTECNGFGYKGRVGLYELMEVTSEVAKAISAQVPEEQLRKIAIQEGMVPLRQAGLIKVRAGVTSVEEILRRTVIHKESLPAYLLNPDLEEYRDSDVIIREGNQDKDFFKLVRGAVAVLKGGKKIAEITEPGEYFGEMAAFSDEPRTASIVAAGHATVKRYPGDKLPEIIEKYPDVAKHLFATLVQRLSKVNRILVKLAGGEGARPRPPQMASPPMGVPR